MTEEEIDRLEQAIMTMPLSALALLWRIVTWTYFGRLHQQYGPKTPPEPPRRTRPRRRSNT